MHDDDVFYLFLQKQEIGADAVQDSGSWMELVTRRCWGVGASLDLRNFVFHDHVRIMLMCCVFISAVPITKLFAWGVRVGGGG